MKRILLVLALLSRIELKTTKQASILKEGNYENLVSFIEEKELKRLRLAPFKTIKLKKYLKDINLELDVERIASEALGVPYLPENAGSSESHVIDSETLLGSINSNFDRNREMTLNMEVERYFSEIICQGFITDIPFFQRDFNFNSFACDQMSKMVNQTQLINIEIFKIRYSEQLRESFMKFVFQFESLFRTDDVKISFDSAFVKEALTHRFPRFLTDFKALLKLVAEDFDKGVFQVREKVCHKGIKRLKNRISFCELMYGSDGNIWSDLSLNYQFNSKMREGASSQLMRQVWEDNLFTSLANFEFKNKEFGQASTYFVDHNFLDDCMFILRKKGMVMDLLKKCHTLFDQVFNQMKEIYKFYNAATNNGSLLRSIFQRVLMMFSEAILEGALDINPRIANLLREENSRFQLFTASLTRFMRIPSTNFVNFSYEFKHFLNNSKFSKYAKHIYPVYKKCITKTKSFSIECSMFLVGRKLLFSVQYNTKKELRAENARTLKNLMSYKCHVKMPFDFIKNCRNLFLTMDYSSLVDHLSPEEIEPMLSQHLKSILGHFNLAFNNQENVMAFARKRLEEVLEKMASNLDCLLEKVPIELRKVISTAKFHRLFFSIMSTNTELNLNLKEEIFPFALNYIMENKEKFIKAKLLQLEFTYEKNALIMAIMNHFRKPVPQNNKLLAFAYLRNLYGLTRQEEDELSSEMGFIYKHYSNWDPLLLDSAQSSEKVPWNYLIDKCKLYHGNECQLISPTISMAVQTCPSRTKMFFTNRCVTTCPIGFVDTGVFCRKPKVSVRTLHVTKEDCGKDCRKYEDLWIKNCQKNHESVGYFCIPICPFGMQDIGLSCKKVFEATRSFYF